MAGHTHNPGDHRSRVLHRRGCSHNRGRGFTGAWAHARGVDFRVCDSRRTVPVRPSVPEQRRTQRALRSRLPVRMVPQRPAKLFLLHARLSGCGGGRARAPATFRVRTVGHCRARQRRHRFRLHSLAGADETHGIRGGRWCRRARRRIAGQSRAPDPFQRSAVPDRRFAGDSEHGRDRRARVDHRSTARRVVD